MHLGYTLGIPNMPDTSAAPALNLTAPALGDAPIGQPVSVDFGEWAQGTNLTADLLRDGAAVQTGLDGSDIVFTPADDEASFVLRVRGAPAGGGPVQEVLSAPVTARYAPPATVPAHVPQVPEIYDEDTGPQTLDLGPAFAGEALLFTAAGLTAAMIDPATGVLTISTDAPISSGQVVVTAQNSGGSAAVTVEIIVEDEGDTILTPTSMQTSVTDPSTGHVYSFVAADGTTAQAREVGQYQDGTWFVLAAEDGDVRIGSISPASTSVSTAGYGLPDNLNDTATVGAQTRWMHGAMVNPWQGVAASSGADTGFDNYYGSNGNGIPYVHAANDDPGATGSPITLTEGTVVKSESFPLEGGHSPSQEDKTRTLKLSCLTVVAEVPPVNSFRPGPRAPSKLSPSLWSFADDAAFDARLDATRPKIPGFRPFDIATLDTITTRIQHFQQTFMPYQEQARRINPGSRGYGINIYGDGWYWYFKHAMAAFVGDYTNAEVREIIKATIQVGIDIYGLLQDDSYYFPWQAHHAGRKGIVMMAGLVLGDQDILDQCDHSLHPEHFGVDDAYCGYVTQEMIGVQPRFYKNLWQYQWEQEHLGLADWSVVFTDGDTSNVATSDQVVNSDFPARNYQTLSFDNGAMYQCLFGMLVDPTARYYNPAYFDFADRYLAVRFGDQIDGEWDASSDQSGVNDHFVGNWWSINPSDTDVGHFKTMRDACARPNYIFSMRPEPLPKPTVSHDGSSPYLDVDFNANNFRMPQNRDVAITRYDLRWTAYAGGADVASSEDDAEYIGNFEWNVIDDITLPYQLTGVPRGLKVKVQLRMWNANGAGPWMDDRKRESYDGAGVFIGVADADARGPRYSANFDVPDSAIFNTAPQNYALPGQSPGSVVTGVTLTGSEGIWTTNPTITATEYKWQVSDDGVTGWTDISGATGLTFAPTSSEEGKHVRFGVRKTNGTGASGWVYGAAPSAVFTPLAIERRAEACGTSDFDPGIGALGGRKLLILFMTKNTDPIALGGAIGAYSFDESDALYIRNANSTSGGARERQAAFWVDVPAGEAASVISFTPSLSVNVAAVYELTADLELIESDLDFDGNVNVATETGGMAFFMGRSDGTVSFGSSPELIEHSDSAASSDGYWAFGHSFATTDQGVTVNYNQGFASNTRVALMSFRVL